MISKEFIPYEQALELKELGFDEPTFGTFAHGKLLLVYQTEKANYRQESDFCTAPTYSQAFKFFRKKKLSDSYIYRYQDRGDGGIYYYYNINHDFGIMETRHFEDGFNSYEEAELECLKKLIELAKQR